MFCENCGNKLEEGERFCRNCGASVNVQGAKTSQDVKNGQGELNSWGVQESQGEVSSHSKQNGRQRAKKVGKKPIIAAVALLLAIVAVGGFFGWQFLDRRSATVGAENDRQNREDNEDKEKKEDKEDREDKEDEDEPSVSEQEGYVVSFQVYSAADVRIDTEGSTGKDTIPEAAVSLRQGADETEGEVFREAETAQDGTLEAFLPEGIYTAQIQAPGYATSYVTIKVGGETQTESFLFPLPEEGIMGTVLTWEGDADLDLMLQIRGDSGELEFVDAVTLQDSRGNRLAADNTAGCEMLSINLNATDEYTLYVRNSTDVEKGALDADGLYLANPHITFYDTAGKVAELTLKEAADGALWKAADITGGQVVPTETVYGSGQSGENWWTESKWRLDIEKNVDLKNLIDTMAACALGRRTGMETDPDWIAKLYQGDWKCIEELVCVYETIPGMTRSQEAEILLDEKEAALQEQDNGEMYYYQAGYDAEQMERIAASVTGGKWKLEDINVLEGVSTGNGTVLPISGEVDGDFYWAKCIDLEGDAYINEMRNPQAEYLGNRSWKVTAEWIQITDLNSCTMEMPLYHLTFTVTRNPDSCFGGYSVTGFEAAPVDNSQWPAAYAAVLTDLMNQGLLYENTSCRLAFIDGDSVPDLLVDHFGWEVDLYIWRNGQVVPVDYSFSYGNAGRNPVFVPYAGIFLEPGFAGAGEVQYWDYSRLNENCEVEYIFQYKEKVFYDTNENDIWDEGEEWVDENDESRTTYSIYDPALGTYLPCTEEELLEKEKLLGLEDVTWKELSENGSSYSYYSITPNDMIEFLRSLQ